MTLDTLFNMAKGTQDAGETVNDVYKVGEISRKTGLQKQQDGSWAPPKGADYQQAKKIHEGVTKTEAARQQAEKIHQGVLKTLSESKEDNAVVRAAKAESASEMAALRKKHDPVTGEGKSYRASKGGRTYAIKASSPEEAKEVLAKLGTKVSLEHIQEVGRYSSSRKEPTQMEKLFSSDLNEKSDKELMELNETLHDFGKSAKGEDFKKIMNRGIEVEKELNKRDLPTNPGGIGYEEAKGKIMSSGRANAHHLPESREDVMRHKIISNMTEEQKRAVMNGKKFRYVKEGYGVVDIDKEDIVNLHPKWAKEYEAGSSNDAACDEKLYTPESVNGPREKLERQLTGDCKIRIRKA